MSGIASVKTGGKMSDVCADFSHFEQKIVTELNNSVNVTLLFWTHEFSSDSFLKYLSKTVPWIFLNCNDLWQIIDNKSC